MRYPLVNTAAALSLLAALTACGSSSQEAQSARDCTPAHPGLETVTPGTLTAATYNFPPFLVVEGTSIAGIEGEILREIAEMECLTLTSQPLDTASVIPATQNGRTDVSAGDWYCTAARAEVLSLAGPVFSDQIVIVSDDGAATFDALQGRSIGTVDGYMWNEELQRMFGASLRVYPNPTAVYNDLESGRLDSAIDSIGTASFAKEQKGTDWAIERPAPDPRVASSTAPGQVCFPMSMNNPELFSAVSENIVTLRDNGRIAEILEENGLDPSAAEPGPLQLIG
ncbi:amino acid ABC transporter substrate-binding protein [Mycolicibacterium murale]|uniref:Amino acid ABC transporter substrate-binding protein n=1 Tax=Mycolicibacterium murale TaxID=182220 RepID=A0A7I9WMA9_9MYCO|nr:transporter substrate-binding domain-containing protein [Mycolicibacterium murale]MCV7185257.1 amino acid ABC transporter substrate-binding protein [Mycolicibacterium murale]GFG58480.1 amino acid ABC transporter substrate-binding protein [Mycolicibacterium murale]